MSGLKGYDQWKTANPPEYDYDIVQGSEKLVKERKAGIVGMGNESRYPWREYIDKLIWAVEELTEYIEQNV